MTFVGHCTLRPPAKISHTGIQHWIEGFPVSQRYTQIQYQKWSFSLVFQLFLSQKSTKKVSDMLNWFLLIKNTYLFWLLIFSISPLGFHIKLLYFPRQLLHFVRNKVTKIPNMQFLLMWNIRGFCLTRFFFRCSIYCAVSSFFVQHYYKIANIKPIFGNHWTMFIYLVINNYKPLTQSWSLFSTKLCKKWFTNG